MSNIDKLGLRITAEKAKDNFMPNIMVPTRDVLALLDELEAAEKRIAELEAREVNLPKLSVGEVMHMSGFSRDYAEGWCSGNDNAIHEIHAAGVKVAAAAGKGE